MKINIRSLTEGLSYALDLAEKSYFSHSKHVAYMSVMIARALNLPIEQQENIYYTALLHDIGASNTYLIEEHCVIGKEILLGLPVRNELADYVYYHHEYFDGSGVFGLKGNEIPLPSQIIAISDLFDKRFGTITELSLEAMNEIKAWLDMNRELFNPKILDIFYRLIEKEYILLDYFSSEFNNVLFRKINLRGHELNYEGVRSFVHAFAEIIDNRSPFTYEHSKGIAKLARKITLGLGYDDETQNKMYIAALLHDIGKLAISNDILDKNGKLDERERYQMNKHTYYTRWILQQIEGFEDITNYAANHHEKLNGNGYPLHLTSDQIGTLDRIMAICDIYQALTEDRPYRAKMPIEKVWLIIDGMANNNELDKEIVERVKVILKADIA